MIEIHEIDVNSFEHMALLEELKRLPYEEMDGRHVAIKALTPAEGARILVAMDGANILGAASYRVHEGAIKRINMGGLQPHKGIGSAFVRKMISDNPGLPMWVKSVPAANGFCKKIGMTACETLENGWRIFRWTAEEAASFVQPCSR